ncbi:probable proton-coupled zinc antiporter SLC30A3 isoform X1 [Kogia breviceps]|uniref:probable proton-coupled zinc antiporter SLC30A3 isoform X1 n=1 Tax=Kogia breviceps TaxID=27615 RepID=UPI0034D201C3
MEPSPATGGSETTRLVSPRDRGGAGGGLRLKSLFTEPSEPLPEEPKPVEMSFHHCHRDPLPQPGLTPERLQAQRQLCAACAVCCVFMAGEVVDVGSMMGSLFSLWLSTRPATRTMTFGWHRSEWPLCCTRPGPTTATGPGGQSMHRWRRGLGSPCPWGTPASGRPLSTCWGTFCRALGCWPPPSSSTSSLNTRQLTPSAPFSSPSVLLDPPLPPSEMFSASSWKVPPEMWGLNLCGIPCCQCQEFGQPTSCTCGPLRLLTMLPPHTWPLPSSAFSATTSNVASLMVGWLLPPALLAPALLAVILDPAPSPARSPTVYRISSQNHTRQPRLHWQLPTRPFQLKALREQAPDAQAQRPWLTGPAAPRHVRSSRTGARTRVPCIGRRTLNHCATREARSDLFSQGNIFKEFIQEKVSVKSSGPDI